jgi:1-acyl-sn-glycerol-3-phosphate acyltransferase
MRLLGALRSFFAMSTCMLLLGVAAPLSLYLVILPWTWLRPADAKRIGADWVSFLARALVFLMRVGGARFEFSGEIDGDQGGVVIMNHQSVLDIPPIIYIIKKRLPRFVIRKKYTQGVPTVSQATRFIDCIPVDPKVERTAAVLALRRVSREGLSHPVLVYPEGHRSRDGEILPFRPAGLLALLAEKPVPVWIIVNDGLWRLRTLRDTLFALGTVRCRLKAIGPVMSPGNPDDIPAFIEEQRQVLIRELAKMRAEAFA